MIDKRNQDSRGIFGKLKVKVAPEPRRLLTDISPWCRLINSLQRTKPNPVPFSPDTPVMLFLSSISKRLLILSAAIPMPVSYIDISTLSSISLADTVIWPPSFVNLNALFKRLRSTTFNPF